MAGMMHFLAEGAAFVPGTVLQPGSLPPPLAPPAPAETSEMRVSGIMHVAVAEVITRGTVPLLSFTNVVGKMSAPNGHFERHSHVTQRPSQAVPFFSVTFGRLAETFTVASAFLFFRTSVKTGTGRGP
jgi:hypothetical protein